MTIPNVYIIFTMNSLPVQKLKLVSRESIGRVIDEQEFMNLQLKVKRDQLHG